MTARQMYDFSCGQVAWYEKQIEWCNKQIQRCNEWLKVERQNDKETQAFSLDQYKDNPTIRSLFEGNYIGTETRKLINERARYYREIKNNKKRIAYYRKEAEKWERFIG